MRLIEKIMLVINSQMRIIRFRCLGNKIIINRIPLVHSKVTLKTQKKTDKIVLGNTCQIKSNTELSTNGGEIVIGDHCFINRNCMVVSHCKINIGDNTTIGPGTSIYDHDHDGNGGYKTAEIKIGNNVWIGAGCIILKGIEIGDNSIVGAGTVLTKSVPSDTIVFQRRDTEYKERRSEYGEV